MQHAGLKSLLCSNAKSHFQVGQQIDRLIYLLHFSEFIVQLCAFGTTNLLTDILS